MRVYLPPAITSLLSTATVVIAVAVFGFLSFKAWEIWTSDASLQQIPEVMEKFPSNEAE